MLSFTQNIITLIYQIKVIDYISIINPNTTIYLINKLHVTKCLEYEKCN